MNLKDFIKKISEVEQNINISQLKYNDFNPWPYIRLSILHKYNMQNNDFPKGMTSKRKGNKLVDLFKSLKLYMQNPIKNENIDILYFTRTSESSELVDNKKFNCYSDSLKHFFQDNYKFKILELTDKEIDVNLPQTTAEIVNIDLIIKMQRLKNKLSSYLFNKKYLMNTSIENELKKRFKFIVDIDKELDFINSLSFKFIKVLQSYNPKLVFLTVFYRPEAMAMSLACHRLGIKVVEYQHGAQNDYHSMYTHWNNLPKEGYELVPDRFWMWGNIPKSRIDKWAKETSKHKAIVGGNLWLTFNKQRDVDTLSLDKHYKKEKVNILVSLQGDNFFSEFLFKGIEKYTTNILWHFRDHPRLPLSEDLKNRILDFHNTEIEFSTEVPLYGLLKKTDIHITGYSTVAFEAQSFNVPTVFIHTNALDGYNTLINKNGLFYAESADELIKLIDRLSRNRENIEPDYIVSDLEIHKEALAKLMRNV